ncbi:MAG: hypothetical protein ACLP59_11685 [Bryobacteraceae bacterium]
MPIARGFAFAGAVLVLVAASPAYSQIITVTPAEPSVVVGQTAQYAAQVTGISRTGVTWYAGGVKGGNSTVGAISARGLYRAPATPPGQNPVQITAARVTDTSVSGSAYAYIIKHGPKITSVSPNPLPEGTYTVTIGGTDFRNFLCTESGDRVRRRVLRARYGRRWEWHLYADGDQWFG